MLFPKRVKAFHLFYKKGQSAGFHARLSFLYCHMILVRLELKKPGVFQPGLIVCFFTTALVSFDDPLQPAMVFKNIILCLYCLRRCRL